MWLLPAHHPLPLQTPWLQRRVLSPIPPQLYSSAGPVSGAGATPMHRGSSCARCKGGGDSPRAITSDLCMLKPTLEIVTRQEGQVQVHLCNTGMRILPWSCSLPPTGMKGKAPRRGLARGRDGDRLPSLLGLLPARSGSVQGPPGTEWGPLVPVWKPQRAERGPTRPVWDPPRA